METVKINLKAASQDRRESYGLLFESETLHSMTGPGLHNRSFPHRIQVWISKRSKRTDDLARTDEPVYRSCDGAITERGVLAFRTSAESVMIASTPVQRDPQGPTLRTGQVIELSGFGLFRITAKALHDPVLVPVDADELDGGETSR